MSPSSAPTLSPTASLTPASTQSPTAPDTAPLTLPPTAVPPPGPDPIQPVATSVVYEAEIFPSGQRRMLQRRTAATTDRRMQSVPPNTDADSCLQACVRTVNALRFFNLYYDDNGDLVCSCVENFTGSRIVETGRVYAVCLATGQGLSIAAKTSMSLVRAGKHVKYKVKVQNTRGYKTNQAATGLTLALLLPPRTHVGVGKAKVLPTLVRSDPKNTKTKVRPTIDGDNVVRWSNFTLNPRRGRTFVVTVRVRPGVGPGTALPFAAAIYQTAPTDSLPYCVQWAPSNSTVRAGYWGVSVVRVS